MPSDAAGDWEGADELRWNAAMTRAEARRLWATACAGRDAERELSAAAYRKTWAALERDDLAAAAAALAVESARLWALLGERDLEHARLDGAIRRREMMERVRRSKQGGS